MIPDFVYLAATPPNMCWSQESRRAYPRVETSVTARWYGMASGCSVRISDLSKGGCYVDSIGTVSVGETLSLHILSSTNEWFELPCVVAHHSRQGFGVRFVDLDDEQRAQICSLIEKH